MSDLTAGTVDDAESAARVLSRLEEAAWVLTGFSHLVESGALSPGGLSLSTSEDEAAARMLSAAGLIDAADPLQLARGLAELLSDGSLVTRHQAIVSTLRQVATAAGIVEAPEGEGWGAQDDATLLAQGRSSSLGGTMLARYAVPSLAGLDDRFADGGDFLDVGVGVAEIAAAFCDAMPNARVVGLDVLPRAVALAHQTIAERGLEDRVEIRLLPVQQLADISRFDLAWMPAPFLPESIFSAGLRQVYAALRPGGWVVVAAGRFDGDALAVSVTYWRTLQSGGTPLTSDEAPVVLTDAGFVDVRGLPTPPGAPALYAGRKPPSAP
jgi:SAM-dependent methyltransferase